MSHSTYAFLKRFEIYNVPKIPHMIATSVNTIESAVRTPRNTKKSI